MLKSVADNEDQRSLAARFRKRRFAFFQSLLARLDKPIRILDVGGTESYWKMMGFDAQDQVFVTLLNLSREPVSLANVSSLAGDARQIEAPDLGFDVVFSNSVIEHVGDHQDQAQMAAEIRRIGKRYFVQTPNRYFPLEPHFLFPFFQFLPVRLRIWMVRHFALGWFAKTPDETEARAIVTGIRLLGRAEFTSLFPGARLYEEKVLGMTKSFVAYGGWEE